MTAPRCSPGSIRGFLRAGLAAFAVTLVYCSFAVVPLAHADGPEWTIGSASSPTNFAAGDETGQDTYVLTVVDDGAGSIGGSPIEIADTLPSGVTASGISGRDLGNEEELSCGLTPSLGCRYEGSEIASGDVLRIDIAVKVAPGVSSPAINSAIVSGGGAAVAATVQDPTTISASDAGFGVSGFAANWSTTQAGAHANLTSGFTLNQTLSGGETVPSTDLKEVALDLPPGFVADPQAIPQCGVNDAENDTCPSAAAVGVAFATTSSGVGGPAVPYSSLVYNATPTPGELGALAMMLPGGPVILSLEIQSDRDYGLRVRARDLSQVDPLLSLELTLWGVPAEYDGPGGPDHVLAGAQANFGDPGVGPASPFLTNAETCDGPQPASVLSILPWSGSGATTEASPGAPSLTGCGALSFEPSLAVAPESVLASEPAGYALKLDVPQNEDSSGPATSELKSASITLPEGTGISLSGAAGLQRCSEAEVGFQLSSPPSCPEASSVGEVEVDTPLMAAPLSGHLFLAVSHEVRPGPLPLYLAVEGNGVFIKLPGQANTDPLTGQVTIVLGELPQIPISELKLRLWGGSHALLANPSSCGAQTSMSDFVPWSGASAATPSSAFDIEGCSGPVFAPAFGATNTTGATGGYDTLAMQVSRTDQEEEMSRIALQTPQAVQEMFMGVPLCGEPIASYGACPQASRIGSVQLTAGSGPDPASLAGAVYLGGPYRGAQQSLSIVVPFDIGPLELSTVVIRASEQIDPDTGQMSIVTDPLPTILDGIHLRLRAFELRLERGEFRLDPGTCEALTIAGTITSTRNVSVPVSATPFSAVAQGSSAQCDTTSAPAISVPPVGRPAPGATTAKVSLASSHLTTTRPGKSAVRLTCTGAGTCRGKLTLAVKTKGRGKRRASTTTVIATGSFSVPPGKTRTIELALTAGGRTRLSAGHGRLDATLRISKTAPAPSQTLTEDVQLLLQRVAKSSKPRRVVKLSTPRG